MLFLGHAWVFYSSLASFCSWTPLDYCTFKLTCEHPCLSCSILTKSFSIWPTHLANLRPYKMGCGQLFYGSSLTTRNTQFFLHSHNCTAPHTPEQAAWAWLTGPLHHISWGWKLPFSRNNNHRCSTSLYWRRHSVTTSVSSMTCNPDLLAFNIAGNPALWEKISSHCLYWFFVLWIELLKKWEALIFF